MIAIRINAVEFKEPSCADTGSVFVFDDVDSLVVTLSGSEEVNSSTGLLIFFSSTNFFTCSVSRVGTGAASDLAVIGLPLVPVLVVAQLELPLVLDLIDI